LVAIHETMREIFFNVKFADCASDVFVENAALSGHAALPA